MSRHDCHEPVCDDHADELIEHVIEGRERDIGAFSVRRLLPSARRRMVGPYIFFDEMGPATLEVGRGMDVRPHPHIGIATVTYLFEGEIRHMDSLGNDLSIRPGAINWMTAGRGIVHSERTPTHLRGRPMPVHGIQLWVALPTEAEEVAPAFRHYPATEIPETRVRDVDLRVLIGKAYGVESPVQTLPIMFYVHARLPAGAALELLDGYSERAAFVTKGSFRCCGSTFGRGQMVVFAPGARPSLEATEDTELMLLGGEPVGERHIWWNFVSSSSERLERAKTEWAMGYGATESFPKVPGDEEEFIPLPE
ncbi:MAG: pirin family protein [Myxococcales bacterium]|nr:pirin family protein [Myxococcales bacterium]